MSVGSNIATKNGMDSFASRDRTDNNNINARCLVLPRHDGFPPENSILVVLHPYVCFQKMSMCVRTQACPRHHCPGVQLAKTVAQEHTEKLGDAGPVRSA